MSTRDHTTASRLLELAGRPGARKVADTIWVRSLTQQVAEQFELIIVVSLIRRSVSMQADE